MQPHVLSLFKSLLATASLVLGHVNIHEAVLVITSKYLGWGEYNDQSYDPLDFSSQAFPVMQTLHSIWAFFHQFSTTGTCWKDGDSIRGQKPSFLLQRECFYWCDDECDSHVCRSPHCHWETTPQHTRWWQPQWRLCTTPDRKLQIIALDSYKSFRLQYTWIIHEGRYDCNDCVIL